MLDARERIICALIAENAQGARCSCHAQLAHRERKVEVAVGDVADDQLGVECERQRRHAGELLAAFYVTVILTSLFCATPREMDPEFRAQQERLRA